MTSSVRLFALTAVTLAAVGAAGCEQYDKPNVPLPQFQAVGLDGTRFTRESLAGQPWVINLWMPG